MNDKSTKKWSIDSEDLRWMEFHKITEPQINKKIYIYFFFFPKQKVSQIYYCDNLLVQKHSVTEKNRFADKACLLLR